MGHAVLSKSRRQQVKGTSDLWRKCATKEEHFLFSIHGLKPKGKNLKALKLGRSGEPNRQERSALLWSEMKSKKINALKILLRSLFQNCLFKTRFNVLQMLSF